MQPGSNSQRNSAKCSGTPADGSQAAGRSHLQRRLIEESDELSREENHHLLSQELWGGGVTERDLEEKAGIRVGKFKKTATLIRTHPGPRHSLDGDGSKLRGHGV